MARVVVLGAGGQVGEGIVRVLVASGHEVAALSRDSAESALLAERVAGRFFTLDADLADEGATREARQRIDRHLGGYDHVVVCLGRWWDAGPLLEADLSDWTEGVHRDALLAHLVAAQCFLPALLDRAESAYVLLNGGTARRVQEGCGLVHLAAAAQQMLQDVLAAENATRGVRINTLLIDAPVRSRRLVDGDPDWPSADDVGRCVGFLLSERASTVRGRTLELSSRGEVPELGLVD